MDRSLGCWFVCMHLVPNCDFAFQLPMFITVLLGGVVNLFGTIMTIVAVFALGTYGDFLPMQLLARSIIEDDVNYSIVFVTNRDNERYTKPSNERVSYLFVSAPSISFRSEDRESFFSTDELFEICATIKSMGGNVQHVVANLFTLSGFILAVALDVHCTLVALHGPTGKCPSSFRESLKTSWPTFYDKLNCLSSSSLSFVTWDDYEQFLWPTLSSEYDELRDKLGLGHPDDVSTAMPRRPLVLLVQSPRMFPLSSSFPRCQVIGCIHSHSNNQLLPTLSPEIIAFLDDQQQRGHSVICIDFGSLTSFIESAVTVAEHHDFDELAVFLGAIFALVCNTPNHASEYAFSFVVVCHGCPMFAGKTRAVADNSDGRIHVVDGDVFHDSLFRRCSAVVHHGGAGTLHSCLHVGIPQIVMPMVHDQFDNGTRIHEMRLGPVPLRKEDLFPDPHDDSMTTPRQSPDELIAHATEILGNKLKDAVAPAQRLRCGTLGKAIREDPTEDGLTQATALITAALCSPAIPQSSSNK